MNLEKLLAENMIRFGVKNLTESDKHRLTEAPIDLLKTKAKDVAAANKFFNTSFNKGLLSPTYLMSANEYCLKTTKPYDGTNTTKGTASAYGPVLSFIVQTFKTNNGYDKFSLPVLPDDMNNGFWEFKAIAGGKITEIRFDPDLAPWVTGSDTELANEINVRFEQLPLETIELMYTAKPSSGFPGWMTKASTSPLWKKVKPLLTGNAKSFFASK